MSLGGSIGYKGNCFFVIQQTGSQKVMMGASHIEGDKSSENNRLWYFSLCSGVTDLAAAFQWSCLWILESQKIV